MAAHSKSVFAAAYSLLKNREDAEDVVQDCFLRYYSGEKQFESDAHLRSWLLRVAVNRAEESRALFRAVGELPEAYRIVIHLHYYEDYPVREIARVLRLPQATVKTRLFRGRELLKKALKEESP